MHYMCVVVVVVVVVVGLLFFCIPLSSSVYLVQQFNNINQGVLSLLEKLYEV